MAIKTLDSEQIEQLAGTRDAQTGITYPRRGLQPYYDWLIRTLHTLAASSAAALRVAQDDASPRTVRILPGRASIDGTALEYAGGTKDLSAFNNETVYIWLRRDGGDALVEAGPAQDNWPSETHIKLASVTVDAGDITDIVDRRFETMLSA